MRTPQPKQHRPPPRHSWQRILTLVDLRELGSELVDAEDAFEYQIIRHRENSAFGIAQTVINLAAQRFEAAAIFVDSQYLPAREQDQQSFDALFPQLQLMLFLRDSAGGKTAEIVI